jgi:hypothetical protein
MSKNGTTVEAPWAPSGQRVEPGRVALLGVDDAEPIERPAGELGVLAHRHEIMSGALGGDDGHRSLVRQGHASSSSLLEKQKQRISRIASTSVAPKESRAPWAEVACLTAQ